MRRLLSVFVVALVSCGGPGGLEPRFVAVHNALSAMGLSSGPISEGSLDRGGSAEVVAHLEGGLCYTFVALGSGGVENIDLGIVAESGEEIAHDATTDPHAAVQVCAPSTGDYQVRVVVTEGHGGYTLSSWSTGTSTGSAVTTRVAGRMASTCADPIPLRIGESVSGSTTNGQATMQGSCASGSAPEMVYRLEIDQRTRISAVLQGRYDCALYIQQECGSADSEAACNDDAQGQNRSEIRAVLEPGTYFVIVDGYGDASGDYDLIVSASSVESVANLCRAAAPLTVGPPVSGSTQGSADNFRATCGRGAASADRVYSLDVRQPSRVRIRQESDHDGVLHVRSHCLESSTEIACNDDLGDNRHSAVTFLANPNQYFVFADGFGDSETGNFTLTAQLAPAAGGTANADTCAGAGTLALGQAVTVDTFEAHDDFAGSCGGRGSPDAVYTLRAAGRSRLTATVRRPEFGGRIYVRRACAEGSAELACSSFAMGGEVTVRQTLEPGTYFLIVDGESDAQFGQAELNVTLDDMQALADTCRRAPLLRSGQSVSGSTITSTHRFDATCAGNAMSNDQVYRLQLRSPGRVRVHLSSDFDAALYIRRDCADIASEVGCNDDHENNQTSQIETDLAAGTYYVIVDGYGTGNQGTYTLSATIL